MAEQETTPDQTRKGMPPGIPYIIGNEAAERFSFYGMRAILTVFMVKYLVDAAGNDATLNDEQAKSVFHLFVAAAYFTPILGAMVADIFWGKYRTILTISLMYCAGHGCLALMDLGPVLGAWGMKPFLYLGLILIAVGAGGIKPCVSAHVGDQFGAGNKGMMTQVFNWFYFSINVGAMLSQALTPRLLEHVGPWLAFGLPGVLMAIATFVFWLGRDRFVHVPPAGWKKFKEETFSPEGMRALKNLSPLFLVFVPMFWAIFDQTGSAWVIQADLMNRDLFGLEVLPSEVQAVNPFFILLGIPLFTYVLYPAFGRFFRVTPLRKVGIGLGLAVVAFAISGVIEVGIRAQADAVAVAMWAELGGAGVAPSIEQVVMEVREAGWEEQKVQGFLVGMPNVIWQFVAYFVLTAAEIMVSIVCLEFAYTQTPPKMKSFVMGVYFLGVSLGNVFVSFVNWMMNRLKAEDGSSPLDGPAYYWFFTGLMLLTTVVYVFWSRTYRGRTFIQGEDRVSDEEAAVESH